MMLAGLLFCFIATFFILAKFMDKLPRDHGREFAVDGAKSAGKARGAGFVFIIVFVAGVVLFDSITVEKLIYLALTFACMMTGFLDDSAAVAWGELKKGLLDAAIAVAASVTYVFYHGTTVNLAVFKTSFVLPAPVFVILAIVLIWTSINVTNCADGVDGLSASLAIVTMGTFYLINQVTGCGTEMNPAILMMMAVLIAYLWFNATPSLLMMGDAGSRAMGFFIAILALTSQSPFIYIPVAIVLILDGGLGLLKVSLLRFLKSKILFNTITPLHDHARKVKGWSNTQCVFRFVILQIVAGAVVVYLVK